MSEQKETWITWLALSTAIMAVAAAITTLYMGKFSTRTILSQAQETDQWAYYQAKSIKQHTFDLSRRQMEAELLLAGRSVAPGTRDTIMKTMAKYDENVKRYESEKEEIRRKAEELAAQKKLAQTMSGNFAYSLIFLQIAIMLSSIAVITKKKPLWVAGLVLTIGWAFFFSNGFLLFYAF